MSEPTGASKSTGTSAVATRRAPSRAMARSPARRPTLAAVSRRGRAPRCTTRLAAWRRPRTAITPQPMLAREPEAPEEAARVGEGEIGIPEDTVAPSELAMRRSTARAVASVARASSMAGSTPRFQGCQRSRSARCRAKRRSASGSPAAVSVARDGAGRVDRLRDGRLGNVGGARVAPALAEVDGDRESLVAVVLDRLHFAQAHRDGLADGGGRLRLGIARPARSRDLERAQAGGLERGRPVERERGGGIRVGHGERRKARRPPRRRQNH